MKKENKKMAQQRRAAERKKQENLNVLKKVIIAALFVVIVGGLIVYGAIDSKKAKSQEDAQSADTSSAVDIDTPDIEEDVDSDPVLDTDPEREVVNGDVVAIHYAGHVGDIYFEGGTGDYDLEIGSHSFIDDFEEQLIGHKVGEEVEVNVTFPEGYGGTYTDADGNVQSLSNVDATFEVTINGIY